MNAVPQSEERPESVRSGTDGASGEAPNELLAVIEQYFDALYQASAEKMDVVFHARGVYATGDETPALVRDKPTYLAVLRERVSPQSRGEVRRDVIDHVELAGANLASARVRCSIGSSDFVDHLTFIRDQGRWQLIAKVFQIV